MGWNLLHNARVFLPSHLLPACSKPESVLSWQLWNPWSFWKSQVSVFLNPRISCAECVLKAPYSWGTQGRKNRIWNWAKLTFEVLHTISCCRLFVQRHAADSFHLLSITSKQYSSSLHIWEKHQLQVGPTLCGSGLPNWFCTQILHCAAARGCHSIAYSERKGGKNQKRIQKARTFSK